MTFNTVQLTMLRPLRLIAFLIILAFDCNGAIAPSVGLDCPNNIGDEELFADHGSQNDPKQCGKVFFSRRKHLVTENKGLEHELNLTKANLQKFQQNVTDMEEMLRTELSDCSAEIQRCNASLDEKLRQSETCMNNSTQMQVLLERQNEECARNVSKLEGTNGDLQRTYNDCSKELASINETLKATKDNYTVEIQECFNDSQSKQQESNERLKRIQALEKENEECTENTRQLGKTNDDLQRTYHECSTNLASINGTPRAKNETPPKHKNVGLHMIRVDTVFGLYSIFKFIILLLLVYEILKFRNDPGSQLLPRNLVYLVASTVIIIVVDLIPIFVLYEDL